MIQHKSLRYLKYFALTMQNKAQPFRLCLLWLLDALCLSQYFIYEKSIPYRDALKCLATSYSHRGKPPTTIGAKELNDRVRHGNGCDLFAIATRLYGILLKCSNIGFQTGILVHIREILSKLDNAL